MEKKTIMQELAEIVRLAQQLQNDVDEYDEILTPNKLWMPGRGVVTLWEIKGGAKASNKSTN